MSKVSQIEHALLSHHITRIRDVNSDTTVFRQSMQVIGEILAFETLRTLKTRSEAIQNRAHARPYLSILHVHAPGFEVIQNRAHARP